MDPRSARLFQTVQSSTMLKRVLARTVGYVLRRAHKVRAVNSLQERQISESFGVARERLVVVPYRVETSRFHPRPQDVPHGHRLLIAHTQSSFPVAEISKRRARTGRCQRPPVLVRGYYGFSLDH